MRRTPLLLALIALVVSACGGNTEESRSPRPTTPGAPVSEVVAVGSTLTTWDEVKAVLEARGYAGCEVLDTNLGPDLVSYFCSRAGVSMPYAASVYVGSPDAVADFVQMKLVLGEPGCLLYEDGQSWATWNLYAKDERRQLKGDAKALGTVIQGCS